MSIKIFVRCTIFTILLFGFFRFAFFGDIGLNKYFKLNNEIRMEKEKIVKLTNKIKNLEKVVCAWSKDNFELEKMAREVLIMGHPNEKVYLLT